VDRNGHFFCEKVLDRFSDLLGRQEYRRLRKETKNEKAKDAMTSF
jgi:hypothetical protein